MDVDEVGLSINTSEPHKKPQTYFVGTLLLNNSESVRLHIKIRSLLICESFERKVFMDLQSDKMFCYGYRGELYGLCN